MLFKKFLIVLFLPINAFLFSQTTQANFSYAEPNNLDSLKKLSLWSTQYFIHKFNSGGQIPIVYENDSSSNLFADTCDFCTAALEGTAYVTDTSGNIIVINFAKTGNKTFVNCRKCKKYSKSKLAVESWGKVVWKKSAGFGDGVKNYKLIPFRTIAVDNNVIPYGTVIFIPLVKGKMIELPNGEKVTHDGYFFAGDTGGAIKKNHIDTFTGVYIDNPFPEVIKSNENKTFDAYIVADKNIIKLLAEIHIK